MKPWAFGAVLAIALSACGTGNKGSGGAETGGADVTISGAALNAATQAPGAAGKVASVVLTHSGPDGGGTQTITEIANPLHVLFNALPVGAYTFNATAYDANTPPVALFSSGDIPVQVSRNKVVGLALVLQQLVPPGTVQVSSPLIDSVVVSDLTPASGETITLTASVASSTDQLTYLWTSSCSGAHEKNGVPTDDLFSAPTARTTSFTSYCSGVETITFSATESSEVGGATSAFSFTLPYASQGAGFALAFNSFPDILSITSVAPASNRQPPFGGTVNLAATVQDADGDALAVSWSDDCGGSFGDRASLTPAWSAPKAPKGTKPSTTAMACRLTLRVTDARGGKNSGWLSVNVGGSVQGIGRRFAVPRFAYATSAFDSTVSAYAVDANSGALTAVGTPVVTGLGPFGVAVTPSGGFAYVANTWDNTVSAYAVGASGGLTALGAPIEVGNGPVAVTVDPSGKFLYVANKWESTISAFVIESSGVPASAGAAPVLGNPYPWGGGNDPGMPDALVVEPSGRFLVAAGPSTVSSFAIDPVSGGLASAGGPVDAGSGDNYLAMDPAGRYVYVAGLNSQSVRAFALDPATGALTSAGEPLATGRNPSAIAVAPSGRFVYVTSSDRTISSYIVTGSGTLASLGAPVATGPATSLAIDPSGKFAYVTGGDAVTVHVIDPISGALGAGASVASGQSLLTMAITGAYPPPFVYVANSGNYSQGNGTLSTYTTDVGSGALTSVGDPIPAGQYPRNLAVDPLGRFLYVPNTSAGTVTVYGIHPATGAPRSLGSTAVASPTDIAIDPSARFAYVDTYQDKSQLISVYAIGATGALTLASTAKVGLPVGFQIDPSGRFLYVATDNGWSLTAYSVDQATGALTLVNTLGTTQSTNIAVDPFGRFLYSCGSGITGFISAYTIDPITGALTFVGNFTTGNYPYCVVDPTGRFLYASTTGLGETPGNRIFTHAIDGGTGVLSRTASTELTTYPGHLVFDPSGRFLYMASGPDSAVSTFAFDPSTGALTNAGKSVPAGDFPVGIVMTAGRASWATLAASFARTVPQFSLAALTSVSLQPGGSVEIAATATDPAQEPARWTYLWSDGGIVKGTFAPKAPDGSDVVYTPPDCSLIGSYSTRGDHVIDLSVVVIDSLTLQSSATVLPVVLHCPSDTYTVYGTVSGAVTAGVTLTLAKDGRDLMTVVSWDGFVKGYYSFGQSPATGLSSGTYTITPSLLGYVFDPPSRTVTVYDAHTGSQDFKAIPTVQFTIGGSVGGYVGSNLVLSSPGEPDLAIPAGATAFTFARGLGAGAAYDVSVKQNPASPAQSCSVTGGKGAISGANVTDVVVTCATKPAGGGFGESCTADGDCSTEYPKCRSISAGSACTRLCTLSSECPSGSEGQKCNSQGFCRW